MYRAYYATRAHCCWFANGGNSDIHGPRTISSSLAHHNYFVYAIPSPSRISSITPLNFRAREMLNVTITFLDAAVLPPNDVSSTKSHLETFCIIDGMVFASEMRMNEREVTCLGVYSLRAALHPIYMTYNSTYPVGSSGVKPSSDYGYHYLGHIRCNDITSGIVVSPQSTATTASTSVTISGSSFRSSSAFSCSFTLVTVSTQPSLGSNHMNSSTTLSVNSFTSTAAYKSDSQVSCEVPSLAESKDDSIRAVANRIGVGKESMAGMDVSASRNLSISTTLQLIVDKKSLSRLTLHLWLRKSQQIRHLRSLLAAVAVFLLVYKSATDYVQ